MPTMQAAVFKGNGVLELEQVEIPKIEHPDQVLLQVRAASICGSDIHALHVPPGQVITPGVIMGHEFFGTIVEMGSAVHGFSVGDCVVVNPCLPCGECWECKHGMGNLCPNPRHYGQTCDGGFAQYALVEASQLYRLPADINPDTAAQTEPLACILSGMGMIQPAPSEHVLLYGAGPIGLTFIQVLKIFGVRHLAVVAKGQARIEQAKKCGADLVIDMQQENLQDVLQNAWGCLADVVIDAVGTGAILTQAVHLVNSHGRLLLFGLNHNAMAQVPPAIFTQKELKLMGVLGKAFLPAIDMQSDERLHLDALVTHRFGLDGIHEALTLLREKKASRVILYPNGGLPQSD
ncbi:zinc-dependent alcohol dehydrogenase [Intestinibacillus sp. Marseille-P6563]|uniref:zinc-dependent alcohol dehydrogenase n=1 Tax=Intestinibacillus sp. Marseille-P6563 TaxID=2364792 RepID=UPI000F05CEE9|nr:alcohol dehydrogenase catalytic domain-containing protein [Intestinibacillus sp. Marseille-P6563]